MLFDGLLGEKASSKDGFLDSLVLREEAIHFIQKFLDIIRSKPEKTQSLYERFQKILKEEEKDNQDGFGTNHMRASEPPLIKSNFLRTLHKRGAEKKMKMAWKKRVSKQKKIEETKNEHQNVKSKTEETAKSGVKEINKKRKPGKKGEHVANKENNLKRKKKKKMKCISRMRKIRKQERKKVQDNRQKSESLVKNEKLENCTSLWAELTNVGLGVATTIKKQVNGH